MKSLFIVGISILSLTNFSCKPDKEVNAFSFLSLNKNSHIYVEKSLVDSVGNKIKFSPYNYPSLYDAQDSLDLLEVFNTLYEQAIPDSQVISFDFIQTHAKRMLYDWEHSPHYSELTWEEFCEYWLPYRVDREKFSDSYPVLSERYTFVRDSLSKGMSVVNATNLLEKDLKSWLRFDLRDHASLSRPSVLETASIKKGGCNTRTEFTCMALRAIGIVSTIDECPVWGHRNSGHQWNVIRTSEGNWLPFNGAENFIGNFPSINDSVKAPKIYRKQFSPNCGFAPSVRMEEMPSIFYNNCRKDVTSEYVATTNLVIYPEYAREDSILYLSVFNDKDWKIVSWAALNNGQANFLSMGCNDIVYLPVYYQRHTMFPGGLPFVLHKNGTMSVLKINKEDCSDRELHYSNVMFDSKWMKASASIGEKLELYYWDNQWVLCDTYTMNKDKILHFKDVPSDGLYLIKGKGWDNTWQRIFTLKGNEQIWY